MTLVTVADFAQEKKMPAITIYKMIESHGIDWITVKIGKTKPFKLYDRAELERLLEIRQNKGKRKTKQLKLNASKLW